MGLCIESDENRQRVIVEIRRESGIIRDPYHGNEHIFPYEKTVEILKGYLKRLVSFFNENPKYLEEKK